MRWLAPDRIDARRLAADPALARRLLLCDDPKPLIVTGLLEVWPESMQQMCKWAWWKKLEAPAICWRAEGYKVTSECPFADVRTVRVSEDQLASPTVGKVVEQACPLPPIAAATDC